ncbi:MAG TPA: hypothetical protein VIL08_00060 [Limnochorda sp.]
MLRDSDGLEKAAPLPLRRRSRPIWMDAGMVGAALCLWLALAAFPGHAAREMLRYRLWLLDLGQVPADSTVIVLDAEAQKSSSLAPWLSEGLLLSAGDLLLPVDVLDELGSRFGAHLLAMAGREGNPASQRGIQDGRVVSLGVLAAYPGRQAQFTWSRAMVGEDGELLPTRIRKARDLPIPSVLRFRVTPLRDGNDGRVLTDVVLEVEHHGRSVRYESTVLVGSEPLPVAGLLMRQSRKLSLGPLPLQHDELVRLAALAVTVEPAQALVPGPEKLKKPAAFITAASLAPFESRLIDWFGPLPASIEPEPSEPEVRAGLQVSSTYASAELDLAWSLSDAARITLRVQDAARPDGEILRDSWAWLGLHGTLARRLELVGGAVFGSDPPRWYVGLEETTQPFPAVTLSASYLLDLSRGGMSQFRAGNLKNLAVFDPIWTAGVTWQARPWRVQLEASRPPGDVDQLTVQVARLADGQERERFGLALEGGVTYRWAEESLEWRLGFRFDVWSSGATSGL